MGPSPVRAGAPCRAGRPARSAGVPDQRRRAGLVAPEQRLAGKLLGGRDFGEQLLHGGRVATSSRGITQPGVRWKTLTNSACLTNSGTIWMALAPVPMTATRLPVEVVVVVPARAVDLVPSVAVDAADVGQTGVGQRTGRQHDGARVKSLPVLVFAVHTPFSSSNVRPVTSWPNWMWRRMSKLVAMSSMCRRSRRPGSTSATRSGS